MKFIFLQQIIKQSTDVIMNTGVVGAILILALIAIYFMARSFGTQLKDATTRMNKYVDEDRKIMIEVIQRNTSAFERQTEVSEKQTDMLESIVSEIHLIKNRK